MIVHSRLKDFMQLALLHSDRIATILRDIRPVFAQKGFDAASMQDLARAANMSAGNFYRYFASKDAIIEAMIDLDMSEMTQNFLMILNAPAPMNLLRQVLAERVQTHRANCDGALWAEMNATAQRRPSVASAVARMEEAVIGYLVQVFCVEAAISPVLAPPAFHQTAALVVMLITATTMVGASQQIRSQHLNAQIMRIINTALDDLNPKTNSRL
jgi:AcrR family transcriptional regulator